MTISECKRCKSYSVVALSKSHSKTHSIVLSKNTLSYVYIFGINNGPTQLKDQKKIDYFFFSVRIYEYKYLIKTV